MSREDASTRPDNHGEIFHWKSVAGSNRSLGSEFPFQPTANSVAVTHHTTELVFFQSMDRISPSNLDAENGNQN
jgi:hypothetical protein